MVLPHVPCHGIMTHVLTPDKLDVVLTLTFEKEKIDGPCLIAPSNNSPCATSSAKKKK